jgi:hypothetical protein
VCGFVNYLSAVCASFLEGGENEEGKEEIVVEGKGKKGGGNEEEEEVDNPNDPQHRQRTRPGD